MKKLFTIMLAITASMIVLTACSSEETAKKESPAPQADKLAKSTLKAVVRADFKTIYNNSQEKYRESLRDEAYGDPNFQEKTDEDIQSMKPIYPDRYKELASDGDYFFGAYYGFLKSEKVVLYYFNGYIEGDRKTLQFELKQEGGKWKIYRYDKWRSNIVRDQEDKYIDLIKKGSDKNVQIFHRGDYYK